MRDGLLLNLRSSADELCKSYEVKRRTVGLEDLLKSGRTTLIIIPLLAAELPPLHLRTNPDRPNDFMIFDRHQIRFLLRLFVSRRKHDERTRST
jgi:hypothetical protein